MTPRPHRITPAVFTALAEGAGGVPAIRQLAAAQRSKQLMLIRTLVDETVRTGSEEAATVRAAFRTLVELQRRAPDAVADVLYYPAVRAWAQRTVLRLRGDGDGEQDGCEPPRPERLAAVAAAAAVRAALTAPSGHGAGPAAGAPACGAEVVVEVPVSGTAGPVSGEVTGVPPADADDGPRAAPGAAGSGASDAAPGRKARGGTACGRGTAISLPSLGVAWLPDGEARSVTVRARPGEALIVAADHRIAVPRDPHTDADGWTGVPRLRAETDGRRIDVLLDDLDPFRFPEMATTVGPWRRDLPTWRERLRAAWRVLVRNHPPVAAEVAAAITVLTPLATRPGTQVSATSREAFGCAAMSSPPDGRGLALTLAHEVQHTKLAALMDLFPLTDGPPGRRYYAPWRPDPRPLSGLLHGAYAHTGVAAFWNRQRYCEDDAAAALHAHTEFAVWREASTEVARFLADSGMLTEAGRRLVAGLRRTLDRLGEAPVPHRALTRARERLDRHRREWLRRTHSPPAAPRTAPPRPAPPGPDRTSV